MIFDTLDKLEMYIPVLPQLRVIADAMDHDDIYDRERGRYSTPDKNVCYEVETYTTTTADKPFEYHKNHTVVEIVLNGQELMSTTWRELKDQGVYEPKSDKGFFTSEPLSAIQAAQGRFAVFFPGEPYKTGIASGEPQTVKKVRFTVTEK